MENISSRKNSIICRLKKLAADSAYSAEQGEYVLDGEKLLREALASGAELCYVLWGGERTVTIPEGVAEYCCPSDVMQSVSPLKSSKGPVFSLKIPTPPEDDTPIRSAIVLENLQDPGNVGTVIRTANAMGTEAVILVGDCARLYSPKTARATMGAVFRQRVICTDLDGLKAFLSKHRLFLYGAALSDSASDIRDTDLKGAAVAIGSEGRGLSKELLDLCDGLLIIPMEPQSESLNAAVAAGIAMWELRKAMEER